MFTDLAVGLPTIAFLSIQNQPRKKKICIAPKSCFNNTEIQNTGTNSMLLLTRILSPILRCVLGKIGMLC